MPGRWKKQVVVEWEILSGFWREPDPADFLISDFWNFRTERENKNYSLVYEPASLWCFVMGYTKVGSFNQELLQVQSYSSVHGRCPPYNMWNPGRAWMVFRQERELKAWGLAERLWQSPIWPPISVSVIPGILHEYQGFTWLSPSGSNP